MRRSYVYSTLASAAYTWNEIQKDVFHKRSPRFELDHIRSLASWEFLHRTVAQIADKIYPGMGYQRASVSFAHRAANPSSVATRTPQERNTGGVSITAEGTAAHIKFKPSIADFGLNLMRRNGKLLHRDLFLPLYGLLPPDCVNTNLRYRRSEKHLRQLAFRITKNYSAAVFGMICLPSENYWATFPEFVVIASRVPNQRRRIKRRIHNVDIEGRRVLDQEDFSSENGDYWIYPELSEVYSRG